MKTAPGLDELDTRRTIAALDALWPYLPRGTWSVVGGLAIRHHLSESKDDVPARPYNGVDLAVAGGFQKLIMGYRRDFYVAHRHDHGTYGALVHTNGVKFNVFPARHAADPIVAELAGGYRVPFQSREHQTVSVLEDVLKLAHGQLVDPKQIEYLDLLLQADHRSIELRTKLRDAWRARHPHGSDFDNSLAEANRLRSEHPKLVRPGLYTGLGHRARQLLVPCVECDPHEAPLTSIWRVAWTMATRRRQMPQEHPQSRI